MFQSSGLGLCGCLLNLLAGSLGYRCYFCAQTRALLLSLCLQSFQRCRRFGALCRGRRGSSEGCVALGRQLCGARIPRIQLTIM
eukprot:COSAG03_NODE_3676_length_1883_cov_6.526906_3_plen_84_part_00